MNSRWMCGHGDQRNKNSRWIPDERMQKWVQNYFFRWIPDERMQKQISDRFINLYKKKWNCFIILVNCSYCHYPLWPTVLFHLSTITNYSYCLVIHCQLFVLLHYPLWSTVRTISLSSMVNCSYCFVYPLWPTVCTVVPTVRTAWTPWPTYWRFREINNKEA